MNDMLSIIALQTKDCIIACTKDINGMTLTVFSPFFKQALRSDARQNNRYKLATTIPVAD
jgi:hypothetical protein